MADKMFSCWLTRNQVDLYTDFITRQPLVLSLLLKSLYYVLRAVFSELKGGGCASNCAFVPNSKEQLMHRLL